MAARGSERLTEIPRDGERTRTWLDAPRSAYAKASVREGLRRMKKSRPLLAVRRPLVRHSSAREGL
jgi:hypothetical protein